MFQEVCAPYEEILKAESPDASETGPEHLLWMLQEIQDESNGMSETKRHRWLGYVQGVMVLKDLITVDAERVRTRPIFKGA